MRWARARDGKSNHGEVSPSLPHRERERIPIQIRSKEFLREREREIEGLQSTTVARRRNGFKIARHHKRRSREPTGSGAGGGRGGWLGGQPLRRLPFKMSTKISAFLTPTPLSAFGTEF